MAVNNPFPLPFAASINEHAVIGVAYPYTGGNNYWHTAHLLFAETGDGELHGSRWVPNSIDFAENNASLQAALILPEDDGDTGEEVRFVFGAEDHDADGDVAPNDDTDGSDAETDSDALELDVSSFVAKRVYLLDIYLENTVLQAKNFQKYFLRREMGVVTTDYPHPVILRDPMLWMKF